MVADKALRTKAHHSSMTGLGKATPLATSDVGASRMAGKRLKTAWWKDLFPTLDGTSDRYLNLLP